MQKKTPKAGSPSNEEIWSAICYLDPDIEVQENESAKYAIFAFALLSWIILAIGLAHIYQT